jgi:hypothetical protein
VVQGVAEVGVAPEDAAVDVFHLKAYQRAKHPP